MKEVSIPIKDSESMKDMKTRKLIKNDINRNEVKGTRRLEADELAQKRLEAQKVIPEASFPGATESDRRCLDMAERHITSSQYYEQDVNRIEPEIQTGRMPKYYGSLSNRFEKGGEMGKGERLNERRLCADWPRLDKVSELQTEITKVNPRYSEGTRWKINCQRCVPTMEMRHRGYDVTAKPKPEVTDRGDLCYRPFDVWENPAVSESKGSGKPANKKAIVQGEE